MRSPSRRDIPLREAVYRMLHETISLAAEILPLSVKDLASENWCPAHHQGR
ncbi:hypothetical protein [Actinomadura sp. KC06]|uniref:hypothetical protein n=1 Tax=Actinomadura sp. KC06 TaxID=2530369 RepID=UPI0014044762|nr:hypothetical protein [Actinomadura sp. KC06]